MSTLRYQVTKSGSPTWEAGREARGARLFIVLLLLFLQEQIKDIIPHAPTGALYPRHLFIFSAEAQHLNVA